MTPMSNGTRSAPRTASDGIQEMDVTDDWTRMSGPPTRGSSPTLFSALGALRQRAAWPRLAAGWDTRPAVARLGRERYDGGLVAARVEARTASGWQHPGRLGARQPGGIAEVVSQWQTWVTPARLGQPAGRTAPSPCSSPTTT